MRSCIFYTFELFAAHHSLLKSVELNEWSLRLILQWLLLLLIRLLFEQSQHCIRFWGCRNPLSISSGLFLFDDPEPFIWHTPYLLCSQQIVLACSMLKWRLLLCHWCACPFYLIKIPVTASFHGTGSCPDSFWKVQGSCS